MASVDAVTEGLLQMKAAAKARVGSVCLLATRSGGIDLLGSSRELMPTTSAPSAAGIHLQQRGAAVLSQH